MSLTRKNLQDLRDSLTAWEKNGDSDKVHGDGFNANLGPFLKFMRKAVNPVYAPEEKFGWGRDGIEIYLLETGLALKPWSFGMKYDYAMAEALSTELSKLDDVGVGLDGRTLLIDLTIG